MSASLFVGKPRAYDASWVSPNNAVRGNIFHHYRSSGNHRTCTNRDSRKDDGVVTEQDIIFHDGFAQLSSWRVPDCASGDVVAVVVSADERDVRMPSGCCFQVEDRIEFCNEDRFAPGYRCSHRGAEKKSSRTSKFLPFRSVSAHRQRSPK